MAPYGDKADLKPLPHFEINFKFYFLPPSRCTEHDGSLFFFFFATYLFLMNMHLSIKVVLDP